MSVAALLGVTASGKSETALRLARRRGDIEIVSVDSMCVYREMDLATAKPSPEARAEVDERRRAGLYALISKRVRRDAPLVTLVWQKQIYVYSGAIEGLRPEPVNSDFWNVYAWRLTTRN